MTHTQRAPAAAERESIAFLSFRLDRRAGRLTRAGETIALRPKTWGVLLYLAERPGVLVTREELLDAVWPGVAVTPDTLTKSIGELRLALGDDSKTPRCIETVHRRGFRFIAQIGAAAERDPSPQEWDRSAADTAAFVGRDDELRQLAARFAKACAGQRQIVFITGPAGVGKTTLVESFLESPRLSGAAGPVWIARGSCIEQYGPREPFMPVLDALERLTRRADAATSVGLLRRIAHTWLAQMPWLLGDDEAALRRSLQAARPERMLREFAILTEALTAEVPIVLVLEDLHWSDVSTVDLLRVLAQRREPARLLVIGTYRPAECAVQAPELSQTVRTLQVQRQCVDLPVHELTTEDVQHYLQKRFPGAEFASTLAPMLHHYTDGNPLFLVAVIEHMLSRGWILETAPGWALSAPPDKLELEVPDDTRRTIQMRLESLSPADRALVEAASVAGTEFAMQAVAAALTCEVEDAEARCEALTRGHRFLRATGTTAWPDGSMTRRYAFTHELYRDAAYGEIPERQRQRLHRRIGAALEAAYGERATEIAAELIVHFGQGCDHARTLHYLAAAAMRARQRFAAREAIRYLEAAIALTLQLPDGDERCRRELELRLALAPVLSDAQGFASEPLRTNCERAYELCTQVGSPAQLFQIVYALCHVHSARSDKALRPKLTLELDELAQRMGTPEHRLLADSVLVRSAAHEGRFAEACGLAEQRFDFPHKGMVAGMPLAYGADPVIGTRCHYAFSLWMVGRTERARRAMRASLAAARESGLLFTLAAALWFSSFLAILCRNTAEARALAEQAVALSAEQGFTFWNAMALALRGRARVELGQVREGIEELERARAAHAATGARLFSTYILAFLADAYRCAGAFEEGLAAVDEGLAVAESTLDRSYWPELWRLKGELLLAASTRSNPKRPHRSRPAGKAPALSEDLRWQEGERCLLRAHDLARQCAAKSLELRAATSLARAWQVRQRLAPARAVLADVCKEFGAQADSVDLAEAKALLGELSADTRTRRDAPRRTAHARR